MADDNNCSCPNCDGSCQYASFKITHSYCENCGAMMRSSQKHCWWCVIRFQQWGTPTPKVATIVDKVSDER